MKPIPIYVGFDPVAEPIAYHAFCQSVIERSSIPVAFIPLNLKNLESVGYEQEGTRDGSNQFIYSRFLVPYLQDYRGLALFCDGDMIVNGDIAELVALADPYRAVQVVKHDYLTTAHTKYLGAKNDDYPRKNWSSVILWNCNHWQNKKLTPKVVMESPGSYLHRFQWLEDRFIGELPETWNYLVTEFHKSDDEKLYHYTLGNPQFNGYQDCDNNELFWTAYQNLIHPLTGNGRESKL